MDSTTVFLAGNQKLQDGSFMASMDDDANIDPMLHATPNPGHLSLDIPRNADPQFVTNLAMWDPAVNNQTLSINMDAFSPKTSNMPHPRINSHVSSWTTSSEFSLGNSRPSSKLATPSLPTSTSESTDTNPPKNTKNTKTTKTNNTKPTKATQAQRRRSSAKKDTATVASAPLSQSAPVPSSRRRSTKSSVIEEEDDDDEEEEEDNDEVMEDGSKRTKFLKRNRIAASKCRQKKKQWVSGLEGTKQELEHQRSTLQMEYNDLVNEVSRMKTQLMQHAGCNDSNINMWIDNEARKFVLNTAAKYQNAACNGINCCQHHRQASEDSVRPMMIKPARSISPEMMNFDHMPDQVLDPRVSFGL